MGDVTSVLSAWSWNRDKDVSFVDLLSMRVDKLIDAMDGMDMMTGICTGSVAVNVRIQSSPPITKTLAHQSLTKETLEKLDYTPEELRERGVSALSLINAGFAHTDMKSAGYSGKEMADGGVPAKDLLDLGFSKEDLENEGVDTSDVTDSGDDNSESSSDDTVLIAVIAVLAVLLVLAAVGGAFFLEARLQQQEREQSPVICQRDVRATRRQQLYLVVVQLHICLRPPLERADLAASHMQ